ncbi:hypothetical protein [Streptomyces sp. AV19]|nr:hypothetical protein [Streptomyces sp. AV19]MDG4532474.1 hypothetical protein [Streptomyces sp. AV19]
MHVTYPVPVINEVTGGPSAGGPSAGSLPAGSPPAGGAHARTAP